MRSRLKRLEARVQFKSSAVWVYVEPKRHFYEIPRWTRRSLLVFLNRGCWGESRGRKMVLNSLQYVLACLCLASFFSSCLCKARIYTNHWAVRIPGGPEQAEHIANKYGYRNLGQVRVCPCKRVLTVFKMKRYLDVFYVWCFCPRAHERVITLKFKRQACKRFNSHHKKVSQSFTWCLAKVHTFPFIILNLYF